MEAGRTDACFSRTARDLTRRAGLDADALVIGGGFFGCSIALALRRMGLGRVIVAERESAIMQRASYVNQARVHNGYHYPRSLSTAERSRINFVRFCRDYGYAIRSDIQKIYAIAHNSRVNPAQFERFCREIDAPCHPAPRAIARLFDPSLIDAAYLATEFAFDASKLRAATEKALGAAGIELRLGCTVRIAASGEGWVEIEGPTTPALRAGHVFNCTYADLDLAGVALRSKLKRELAEMALIQVPPELRGLGITVMDGAFFSTMPFPAESCHSLSHVRYTPHESWTDGHRLGVAPVKSNWQYMLRDAARYLPSLSHSTYVRSIFELKAVLVRNEDDDGRPILFERSEASPRIISVLGGKVDNIYDILDLLENESWKN